MTGLARIALFTGVPLLLGAAPVPAEYVVAGDGIVAATVAGAAGRIRVDPGAPSMPVIDDRFRIAAGLKPGMFGVMFRVGPLKVHGASSVADFIVGGVAFKRRAAWFDRAYDPAAAPPIDGVVGPGSLPSPVVRFQIHAARPGEHVVALPLVDAGGLVGNWGGVFAEIMLEGAPLKVRFDLRHRHSLATAGTGQRIATAYGGALRGPIEQAEIVFGIERPVRQMKLARPLAVGPLSLDDVYVRVSDYGSVAAIPDADAVADPDEIVVIGKKKRDQEKDRLSIGLDQLERCSSLTFDKPAKVIRLSCL